MRCAIQIPPLAFLLLLAALAGCSGGGESFPVTGTVTLDGKPAEGVQVKFFPAGDGDKDDRERYGTGVSGKDGKFELRSFSEKGFPSGEYKVTFSRPVANGKVAADPTKKVPQTRESLPAKYVDLDKTTVTAGVSKSKHEFGFDLVSESK